MTKHIVTVITTVEVTLDDAKFTPDFFAEYVSNFAPYDTVEDHAEHLAWVHATGVEDLDTSLNPFVEGYGPINDFGIRAVTKDTEVEYEGLAQ